MFVYVWYLPCTNCRYVSAVMSAGSAVMSAGSAVVVTPQTKA